MAQFLTTREIAAAVEKIIRGAQSTITLISPFVKISPDLLQRLKDAMARGVTIRMVYGKESLNTTEWHKIAGLELVQVYFLQRLHAKCFMNESQVVVTSLNLHGFSEQNNREMGVLLDIETDSEAFQQAVAEVESIIQEADHEMVQGRCIRCGSSLPYDPYRPFCEGCFSSWAQWGNDDFEEKYCHRCGRSGKTSRSRPLCIECFREASFERVFL